ncbi:MAG TPA: hypothetical protein VKH81_17635 [Candidatus Angelobacter sp.]|nr:hypothetical protein [Candidatus Angelobacter sp.]
MRLRLIPLIVVLLVLAGCGQINVGVVSNPGFPTSVTGTIITVQVQSSKGPNGAVNTFTLVSIQSVNTTNTFNFCGDQHSLLPLNQEVRIDFNSGVSCATLITVVVL